MRAVSIALHALLTSCCGNVNNAHQRMPHRPPPAVPQLINWQKRRSTQPAPCRLFRLAAHSAGAPQYLVPKAVLDTRGASLDPRGAFVVQLPGTTLVWRVRNDRSDMRGSDTGTLPVLMMQPSSKTLYARLQKARSRGIKDGTYMRGLPL